MENKSYDELYSELKQKVYSWVMDGNTPGIRQWRHEQIQFSMQAFRNSNSSFDLFLFNTYFSFINRYPKAIMDYDKIPTWIRLTDPMAFENTLPYFSFHYLTDYLFQNSYDFRSKAYLLAILRTIKFNILQSTEAKETDFYFAFNSARRMVDEIWPKTLTPTIYNADLHIYSERWDMQLNQSEALDHLKVQWNSTLNRLQTIMVESYPTDLNKNALVDSHPELKTYVKQYFDIFRKNKSYSEAEIDEFEKKELASPLDKSTYLVFTKVDSSQLLTMVRIFDATNVKSFIEEEFPNVHLSGRENRNSVFELGRLYATDVVEAGSLRIILARTAEYFKITNAKGIIYFDANKAAMKFYRRLGASIVYNPEQLSFSLDKTPQWIMKFSVEDFVKLFYRSSYEVVKMRAYNVKSD